MRPRFRSFQPVLLAFLLGIVCAGCGSKSLAAPGVTVTGVQVTPANGGSTSLAPGETRQLAAMATRSDGTSVDVTGTATWQSSAT